MNLNTFWRYEFNHSPCICGLWYQQRKIGEYYKTEHTDVGNNTINIATYLYCPRCGLRTESGYVEGAVSKVWDDMIEQLKCEAEKKKAEEEYDERYNDEYIEFLEEQLNGCLG